MRGASTALIAAALALLPWNIARADVRVLIGATPIMNGNSRAPGDITVVNEKLAFALAVNSPMPYGVPRGAIIDIAPVLNGRIGRDRVVFADFIPNHWSAWPNTSRHVEILEQTTQQAVIRSDRDWGKVNISTVYTLKSGADAVEIETTMTNRGELALRDLLSGLTLWPNSGYLFSVPGMAGIKEGTTEGALSDRVTAYDADWAITLHAPYMDHVGAASKDLYQRHALAPGESRRFTGWLQVGSSGDLAPVLQAEIDRKHLPSATITGRVTARDGQVIKRPVIVIEKQGKPFAWAVGRESQYEFRLPEGEYALYATAKSYSQSLPVPLTVVAASPVRVDFTELQPPGHIRFAVVDARTGRPLDARISIQEGQKPLVESLGKTVFFTELGRKGLLDLSLAPGKYRFNVSSGGGFLSPSRAVDKTVVSGATAISNVSLEPMFDPTKFGWYSADLHHHADQAEAVTPPTDLARSQLAAGLNLLFVSDHDSTVNHAALQRIADQRQMPFIAGIELSPSWGHFNAYPLKPGQSLAIDTSSASVGAIIQEARRLGAMVVQVNHPFISYGYLASVAAGVAPGGFNPEFDVLEINADTTDDDKVLQQLWDFWSAGHRYYLAAGTDTHNVWSQESGRVRVFAHVEGPASAASFARALKDGHAYVSYGPLMFPSVMFGDTLKLKPNQVVTIGVDLASVAGIKNVRLIGNGLIAESKLFDDSPQEIHVDFKLDPPQKNWYALVVEDEHGRRAYSDPIWVDVIQDPLHSAP